MNIKEVTKLSAIEIFLYWIHERENIRLAKQKGLPKPWTNDAILQTYKFCNVHRMDDKVSQWLLTEWYIPNCSHSNMMTACTLARQLNNPESLEAVGFPFRWNAKQVKSILDKRASDGLRNFSAAYMITGTLGGTKVHQIVNKVVTPLHRDREKLWKNGGEGNSMRGLWKHLLNYAGFSTFIAGQVVADLRHAAYGSWKDCHFWAPVGPGSRRGLNRILGRPTKASMPQKEFDVLFPTIIDVVKSNVPGTEHLEAIDIQNCLCETDKYIRVLRGEGRPKQKYPGVA